MLFDYFDRIRIVNLPHRTDRRAEMNAELRRVGLDGDPRVKFFDAFSFREAGCFRGKGSNGSFHSHLAILKEASHAGVSVLILQDDCDFLPGAELFELPDGWSIFYGGYEASDPADLENSDIIGAHFMGFSAQAVALACDYLDGMLKPDFKPDPKAAAEPGYNPSIRPPIDGACVWFRRAHPELLTIFAVPKISRQRSSRSDCTEPRFFDRFPKLRQLASLTRKFRRRTVYKRSL